MRTLEQVNLRETHGNFLQKRFDNQFNALSNMIGFAAVFAMMFA